MSTDAIRYEAGRPYFEKDPRAKLPVAIDWSEWIAQEGTSISTSEWTATGLTVSAPTLVGSLSRCLVEGGVAGTAYDLRCTITCANGAIDSRSLRVVVRDR